ncbi:hypothetical protein N7463_010424 [Penicillium fimorum]|uniref:Uncharacterized protein n=1 Tax=Penicillium fimorum TaxID=1882269 RepID=A0A9W9XJU8_9EURO|nr:hypothetical protein N7463_010424 [Penicillium fimorum]
MAIPVGPEIKEELSEILQAFLLDIVEDEVKLHFKDNGFSDEFVKLSVGIATTAFQMTPFNIQCTVAIFTIYCVMIDDSVHDLEFKEHLNRFNICLLSREPQ